MIVLLDSGPLGLLANPTLSPQTGAVGRWVIALRTAGVRVYVPEITDYEVRRELLRTNRTQAIARLDALAASAGYLPLTTAAMRRAAEFWALVRRAGVPTASPDALDADCILAAQASLLQGPGDVVTIATRNLGHLGRFPGITAQPWDAIVP